MKLKSCPSCNSGSLCLWSCNKRPDVWCIRCDVCNLHGPSHRLLAVATAKWDDLPRRRGRPTKEAK